MSGDFPEIDLDGLDDAEVTAEATTLFCNGVIDLINQHDLPGGLVVALFGRLTRHLVEHGIDEGDDKTHAVQEAVGFFMNGMGFRAQRLDNKDLN